MSAVPSPDESLQDSIYLDAYLAPFKNWLERSDVSEVIVNQPGEVWIESSAQPGMTLIKAPQIDDILLKRLAEQVARVSHQGVNRERPLLAAMLPNGARIQMVGPPATRGHWAMAIRRHRLKEVSLADYDDGQIGRRSRPLVEIDKDDPLGSLRHAVAQRATILISGGTSSGKTTFLNALLREVPSGERVVLVEDTPEIRLHGSNGVGLIAVKGELGEAKVTADDLLQAALRLRPDRIVLGELRGSEAVSFLRAINTGHPGSFTTIHANSPQGALEQLALMVMQTGLGLSRSDTIAYARTVIDIVVQLDRQGGRRVVSEIVQMRAIKDAL